MSRKLSRRSSLRPGFSMVEVVVSSLLVGLVLVGAMRSLGAMVRGRVSLGNADRAALLAVDLLSEILENEYEDPDEVPIFGAEASETGGTRADFDDVDDFHAWDATPPEDRGGTPIANLSNWRRRVIVEYVDPNDLTLTVGSDQGVKRITVEVYHNGALRASQIGVRTSAWEGSQ